MLVIPTLKNDFVNAANVVAKAPDGVHLTLSMSFPDLARSESILPGMTLLEEEYPGVFTWNGGGQPVAWHTKRRPSVRIEPLRVMPP